MWWRCCQRKKLQEENDEPIPEPTSLFTSISFGKEKKQTPLDFLRTQSFEQLHRWTLEGSKCYGKVTRVIDGDTLEIVILVQMEPQKHVIRLTGIDAPELKPRLSVPYRDLQIQAALKVRDVILALLAKQDNLVWIEIVGKDKFGRWMGEIFLENKHQEGRTRRSINNLLLSQKFVKEYHGHTREIWNKKELEQILDAKPRETESTTP